jgi:5'-phosphate synthase pdxT subunit
MQEHVTIGILALQGDFAAHARMLEQLGLREQAAGVHGDTWRYVRRSADLEGLDGLIIPGGESTTMLKFLEDAHFWERLQHFVSSHPTFGTCAGAILLAKRVTHPEQRSLAVLDATVMRNAYGRQIDSSIRPAECSSALRNGSGEKPLEAVFIRAPQFSGLGAGVEVLAFESGLPVLIREGQILAATFHPELTGDTRVHELFLKMVGQKAVSPISAS